MDNNKEELEVENIQVVENFNWIVPQCCREGWESCPHGVKKQKKTKNNIGL